MSSAPRPHARDRQQDARPRDRRSAGVGERARLRRSDRRDGMAAGTLAGASTERLEDVLVMRDVRARAGPVPTARRGPSAGGRSVVPASLYVSPLGRHKPPAPTDEERRAAEVDLERIRQGGIPLGAEERLKRVATSK